MSRSARARRRRMIALRTALLGGAERILQKMLYREEATMSRRQDPAIRRFILENVETYPGSITSVAAQMFGMTRTGIARYMKRLIAEELITAKGTTRARRYQLKRRKISDDTA